jgi:hypothetical protein
MIDRWWCHPEYCGIKPVDEQKCGKDPIRCPLWTRWILLFFFLFFFSCFFLLFQAIYYSIVEVIGLARLALFNLTSYLYWVKSSSIWGNRNLSVWVSTCWDKPTSCKDIYQNIFTTNRLFSGWLYRFGTIYFKFY